MRTYGRTTDNFGNITWNEVDTAVDGSNDILMVTAMCQTMLLNLGESPIFASWGIPAQQSVLQQIYPDLYLVQIQKQYAGEFASLSLKRSFLADGITPVYQVTAITHTGVVINAEVPIPF